MRIEMATALRGMLDGAASQRADVVAWHQALASPLLAARRVGFVHADRQVGSTTVALAVARLIATSRSVLGVDLASSPQSSGIASVLTNTVTPRTSVRESASTSAGAREGLIERGGMHLLYPENRKDPVATWLREAAPIARFFDTTITDFGMMDPRRDMGEALALCDLVCVVAGADRASAEMGLSLARGAENIAEQPASVLVLVDRQGRARAQAEVVSERSPVPVSVIPRDSGLTRHHQAHSTPAKTAVLRLSALIAQGGTFE